MNPKYIKTDINSCLAHLIEETGEVLSAVGKIQRFGLNSFNPELPPEERETNFDWLCREINDLEQSIIRLKIALNNEKPID